MPEKIKKNMVEIIEESQELINTLETLNKEIESYQLAKNNLIEVKEQLQFFVAQSIETNKSIKESFISVNEILESELISRLDNLDNERKESEKRTHLSNSEFKFSLNSIIESNKKAEIVFSDKLKIILGVIGANTIGVVGVLILILIK